MLTQIILLIQACVPQQNIWCTREFMPVCGNGTTYNNICLARAAGFHGNCEKNVQNGACQTLEPRVTCEEHECLSEKGFCVSKPWSDFNSCEMEKAQGACPGSHDPNPWVGEHCAKTCGVYTRGTRISDTEM